jgi:hypothetical protein
MRVIAVGLLMSLSLPAAEAFAAAAPCRDNGAAMRVGTCPVAAQALAWMRIRQALGIGQANAFGAPDACGTQAQKLAHAWQLLESVELPGLGNAAGYVDRSIDSAAFDGGLGTAVRAQYVQGRRTLLLGPALFDPALGDAERAAVLLHEARHAAPGGHRHVLCGARSSMAWRPMCDRRFDTDLAGARAGPWSLEVVFLSLLREARPCLGRADLDARIRTRLAGAFGVVAEDQRKALRALVRAHRRLKRRQPAD